jgi:hypothetical protein
MTIGRPSNAVPICWIGRECEDGPRFIRVKPPVRNRPTRASVPPAPCLPGIPLETAAPKSESTFASNQNVALSIDDFGWPWSEFDQESRFTFECLPNHLRDGESLKFVADG